MGTGAGGRVETISAHTLTVSDKTRWIIVRVVLDDGSAGHGEATDFGRNDVVLGTLRELGETLVGTAVSQIFAALANYGANRPAARVACSGIEQAVLDASARSIGTSIAALLGGSRRSRVPVYANINRGVDDRSPSSMAAAAGRAVDQGYRAIKIAPFDEVRPDQSRIGDIEPGIARIFAVRSAIGSDTHLRVDCHLRLTPQTAEAICATIDGVDIDWIEDVLDPGTYPADVRRALRGRFNDQGIRVAGGEDLWTIAEAADLLSAEGLDVLLPDLRQTGVRDGLVILELASALGISASLHSPVSPILDGISLQVGAAASDFFTLERQVNESPLYAELADAASLDAEGWLTVPDGCGPLPRMGVLQQAFEGVHRVSAP